ncbi:diguanylate cyclase domain-containing protein [Sulfurimonas sp.]
MNNLKLNFFTIFIILFLGVIGLGTTVSNIRLNKLIELENSLIATTYKSIISEYNTHANILIENVVNKDEILKIFAQAESSPKKSRDALFQKLQPTYENMKSFKLRQLHFHLKNNDSFLRFHRPEKYGDNLSDIRITVKHVNETHLPVIGFEEGRVFHGYRFVYPLSYGNEHIGSVETSISMQSVIDSLSSLLNAEISFFLDKKTVLDNVFKDEVSNYKEYDVLPGHFTDKSIKNSKILNHILKKYIDVTSLHITKAKKSKVVSFYKNIGSKDYIISMVSINKALSDKTIAHVVILREHPELYYLNMQKNIVMFLFILLIGLVIYYVYKFKTEHLIIELKNKALTLSEKKFRKLFDLQKNIMVVTDGKNMQMVNDALRDFFGAKYLESITANNADISSQFIKSENYFNIDEIPKNLTWIEAIKSLHGDKKIVAMYDKNNNIHTFNISISDYDKYNYIVLFADISDTIKEKVNLSNKVIKDTLTGALNREFFETSISVIIEDLNTDKYLGVAMLDIDFFKSVNDVYGHDAGDVVLIELTTLIKSTIRDNDYLIRWGGEEFIILLETSSKEVLHKTLENVRTKIDNTHFSTVENITCSFGATLYDEDEDIKETILRADKALYEVKRSGRNKVITI